MVASLNHPYYKVVARGQLYGRQDFSYSYYISAASDEVPTQAGLEAVVSGTWHAAAATWYGHAKIYIPAASKYSGTTYYGYTAAGEIVAQVVDDFDTVGTGTDPYPAQCASVLSLRTAGFGRSFRGRVYMPNQISPVGTDGTMSASDVDNLATQFAAYLSGTSETGDLVPAVASFTKGQLYPITTVEVDNVIDTQRRRRDKITATAVGSGTVVLGP